MTLLVFAKAFFAYGVCIVIIKIKPTGTFNSCVSLVLLSPVVLAGSLGSFSDRENVSLSHSSITLTDDRGAGFPSMSLLNCSHFSLEFDGSVCQKST